MNTDEQVRNWWYGSTYFPFLPFIHDFQSVVTWLSRSEFNIFLLVYK